MADKFPTGHMIVKNEDRFIWYSISSVIDYLSQLLIFDTGSTDKTKDIIKSFKTEKIIFEEKGSVYAAEIAGLRQEQIDRTKTDWFWIIDGDEIYPKSTAEEIINHLKGKSDQYEGGVVRRFDLLGDIYHYQSEKVGEYNLYGEKGHLVLRLLNKKKLTGLKVKGVYPYEAYYDKNSLLISDHPKEKFFITKNRLFHAMYLQRSSLGGALSDTLHRNKIKVESGYKFPENQQFPGVFYGIRPDIVVDVSYPRGIIYEIIALIITPLKKLKRSIWSLLIKVAP